MMDALNHYLPVLIKSAYFVAAILFITGLRRMSKPGTARGGIVWAGIGMLLATVVTFLLPDMHNMVLILAALASSTVLAWVSGRKVAMTDMPQMVALYNGMGGGSAAFIGMIALFNGMDHVAACEAGTALNPHDCISGVTLWFALAGVLIGGFLGYTTPKGKEFARFVRNANIERQKIVWPTKNETIQSTIIVIVMVLVISFFLFMLDTLFSNLVDYFFGS